MDRALKILKRPLLSEKSTSQTEKYNQVSFEVSLDATKPQVKQAVERLFKVKIVALSTIVMPGKPYRSRAGEAKSPKWKKAIITLKEGNKIEFFKGV